MGTPNENVWTISGAYSSQARYEHALAVCKLEDLYAVQYGIDRLNEAELAISEIQGGVQLLDDNRTIDDSSAWMEFVLLRFELHAGSDEGDFAYQEYAAYFSEEEKKEFLQVRKLRRRHIQHLSPKWLRENTLILDAEEDTTLEGGKLTFEVELTGPNGEKLSFCFELPEGRNVRLPFYMSQGLTIDCIDWQVFSGGVARVIECLEREIPHLQSKLIAEINSLPKSEREKILIPLRGPQSR